MSWGRIDDGFHDHPKVEELSLAAVGLWTLCLTRALRHWRTDPVRGFVSEARVKKLAGRQARQLTLELVTPPSGRKFGLWEPIEGGWLIHDFEEYLRKGRDPEEASASGRKGAAARWGKDGKSHDDSHADSHSSSHGSEMAPDGSRAAAHASRPVPSRPVQETPTESPARTRASRLADDWKPSAEDVEWQRAHGISDLDARRWLERFVNYWTAKSGKDATKLDWSKTWRNWLLTEQERQPRRTVNGSDRDPVTGQPKSSGFEFGMDR